MACEAFMRRDKQALMGGHPACMGSQLEGNVKFNEFKSINFYLRKNFPLLVWTFMGDACQFMGGQHCFMGEQQQYMCGEALVMSDKQAFMGGHPAFMYEQQQFLKFHHT